MNGVVGRIVERGLVDLLVLVNYMVSSSHSPVKNGDLTILVFSPIPRHRLMHY